MQKKQIFDDTTAYIFDELDNYLTIVYLIKRNDKYFLIDTFCGSSYMDSIKKDMDFNKEIIVINTHFHFDHIWGNASFENSKIIAHEKCNQLINENWDKDFEKYGKYFKGINKKVLANLIFEKKLCFENEGIMLFHTPGHSIDSISIYDSKNKAIYCGDNLEKPIIQLCMNNKYQYVKTLQKYLKLDNVEYFASHTLKLSKNDILTMINYLENIKYHYFEDKQINKIHLMNLKIINDDNF